MNQAEILDRNAKAREKHPDHRVEVEPSPRRVRVVFNGETIVDSTHALLLRETRYMPTYYFPREDVHLDRLIPTDHGTFCPFKGEASYWSVEVEGRTAENAVWGYADPIADVAVLKDHMAFYWDKMDSWFEEDEEIFVHPRDPYKRVDVIGSSRHVQIILGGTTIADSTRARLLFETGLPTRYYIPAEDIQMDLLEASATRSMCPYKGEAAYFTARIAEKNFDDIAWTYPDPIPECPKIKDLICFFNEKVDDIFVDGERAAKVKTPWS